MAKRHDISKNGIVSTQEVMRGAVEITLEIEDAQFVGVPDPHKWLETIKWNHMWEPDTWNDMDEDLAMTREERLYY